MSNLTCLHIIEISQRQVQTHKRLHSTLVKLHSRQDTMSARALYTRHLDHLQAHSNNVSRITRVNDSIVEESRAGPVTLAVSLHTIFKRLRSLLRGRTVDLFALGLGAIRLDCLHHAGQLVGPHDTAAPNGPGK